jgi:hypothetical protein
VDLKNLIITYGHETVGAEFAGSKANLFKIKPKNISFK